MAHTKGIESAWGLRKRFYDIYHSFSEKRPQRHINEFFVPAELG